MYYPTGGHIPGQVVLPGQLVPSAPMAYYPAPVCPTPYREAPDATRVTKATLEYPLDVE